MIISFYFVFNLHFEYIEYDLFYEGRQGLEETNQNIVL